MAKQAPLYRLSGIVDRPKKLLVIDESGVISALDVLFMRLSVVAQRQHVIENRLGDTIGLVISPALFQTSNLIRYSNDIVVHGRVQPVTVLHHPHDDRQITHLIKAGWAKIQQVQAGWSAKYITSQAGTETMAQGLERLTAQWSPQLNNLAAYQQRVWHQIRLASVAAQQALVTVQARQRQIDAKTRAAVAAVSTQLLVIKTLQSKPATIVQYGRPQRERGTVDPAKLADPAYLHQQAQEIMLDYQFAQAHHLPLASRSFPWDAAELARWQQWVDQTF